MRPSSRTLFDRIGQAHEVQAGSGGDPSLLYIDLHLVHEVTSPQAFAELANRGLRVRRPDRTLATMDHSTPTTVRSRAQMADGPAGPNSTPWPDTARTTVSRCTGWVTTAAASCM